VGVFICHRHVEGSEWAAAFLADSLGDKFGPDEVFIDVHSIRGGDEWRRKLAEGVGYAQAVLVLIDSGWAVAREEDGTRRLDNPRYWVRKEIEIALEHDDVRMIPVLLGDAAMPKPSELPPSMASLTDFQEVRLRHATWQSDLARLTEKLDDLLWVAPSAQRRMAEHIDTARRLAKKTELDRVALRRSARAFPATGVDPRDVADNLAVFFEEKGMKSRVRRDPSGYRVEGEQRGGVRAVAGLESAITVLIMPDGEDLLVHVKAGRWRDKATAIALFPLTGGLTGLSAAYGAARHAKLPEDTYRRVESYLLERRARQ